MVYGFISFGFVLDFFFLKFNSEFRHCYSVAVRALNVVCVLLLKGFNQIKMHTSFEIANEWEYLLREC